MKKIWLMGGFGNVLFQILAYNAVKKKLKPNEKVFFVELLTEPNFITKTIKWKTHQKLYRPLIDEKDTLKIGGIYAFFCVLVGFLSKFLGKYFSLSTFYLGKVSLDTFPLAKNIFGYFQDKSFLSEHSLEIGELGMKIRQKFLPKSQENEIVVHYRKGDSDWAVMYAYYYEEIKERLKKEQRKAVIVTDSYDDAKNFFKELNNNIEIVKSSDAIEDFKTMLNTKELVCAPSTFSWWAAHTLPENAKVIFPKFLEKDLGIYVKCQYETI